MGRTQVTTLQCVEPGCREVGRYAYDNRKDYERIHRTYSPYKCFRHSNKATWLTPEDRSRTTELTVAARSHGLYFEPISNGYTHGPGFNAYASEFPAGTRIIVTATALLPDEVPVDLESRGYAPAVADIRQLALDNANRLSGPEMAKAKSRVVKREIWVAADALLGLVTVIDCGAHVGAAKKASGA